MNEPVEKRKILVIDDEKAIVTLVSRVLSEVGYDVLTANDGEEGLQIIEQTTPDLIILDVNMPNMGGLSFYHRLGSRYDTSRELPILVMTGQSGVEPIFDDLKVEGVMTKPIQMDELTQRVKQIIRKRDAG